MSRMREIDPLLGELYLAGDLVPPGVYRPIDGGTTVHLERMDTLPASMDGRVACYARLQNTWGEIVRHDERQFVFSRSSNHPGAPRSTQTVPHSVSGGDWYSISAEGRAAIADMLYDSCVLWADDGLTLSPDRFRRGGPLSAREAGAAPDFAVAGVCSMASGAHGDAGDFWDVFHVSDHRLVLAVGNTSGLRARAATRAGEVRDMLRESLTIGGVGDTLARMNDCLCAEKIKYKTADRSAVYLSVALVDTASGEAVLTAAGMEPPAVLRASGEIEIHETGALPLGLFPGRRYPETRRHLNAGDLVFLVTGSETEARRRRALLTIKGVAELALQVQAISSAQKTCQAILIGARPYPAVTRSEESCLFMATRH